MFIASATNISGAVRTSGQLTCDVSLNFFVRSSDRELRVAESINISLLSECEHLNH